MPSTSRRTALLGVSAALGTLAGCSEFSLDSSEPTHLGELTVNNYGARPYTVRTIFVEDGEPVYWATKDVPAASGSTLGGARFEGYPSRPGDAVLYARFEGDPPSEWARFDFEDHDSSCLGIAITIGDINDRQAGELSVRHTTDPDVCRKESDTTE